MKLTDFFEKIYILNLPYKPERKIRTDAALKKLEIADFEYVEWVRAISGDICSAPAYFQAGNGAWGCLQTHSRIVQDAAMDEIESCLILEDDVLFHPRSSILLERFLDALPADWDQVYLGGQHLQEPEETGISPLVLRGKNINRTHAYGLHSRVYQRFLRHIHHAPDYLSGPRHIDHQLGLAHERRDWNTYCPEWWIAGQSDGPSNISGRMNAEMWWHPTRYARHLPFIFVPSTVDANSEPMLQEYVHFGWNLKPDTFTDTGLEPIASGYKGLGEWMQTIAGEAICRYRVPGLCHPEIPLSMLQKQWADVRVWDARMNLAEICSYPMNGLFDTALTRGI